MAGIVWPIVLLIGFMMAFLLIGLVLRLAADVGGTISTEGTDAFGALSHSYSYVYQRPLHYLLYAVVAAPGGRAGLVPGGAVRAVDHRTDQLGRQLGARRRAVADINAGNDLGGPIGNCGAAMIRFWNGCVSTLAFAFALVTCGARRP